MSICMRASINYSATMLSFSLQQPFILKLHSFSNNILTYFLLCSFLIVFASFIFCCLYEHFHGSYMLFASIKSITVIAASNFESFLILCIFKVSLFINFYSSSFSLNSIKCFLNRKIANMFIYVLCIVYVIIFPQTINLSLVFCTNYPFLIFFFEISPI